MYLGVIDKEIAVTTYPKLKFNQRLRLNTKVANPIFELHTGSHYPLYKSLTIMVNS